MYNPPRSCFHREIKPPCKGCSDRRVGCHGDCQKYSEYKAELDGEKTVAKNACVNDHKTSDYEYRRHRK